MMEDDLFLTAPWTLEDFVSPTGGHILTGELPGRRCWRWLRLVRQIAQSNNTVSGSATTVGSIV